MERRFIIHLTIPDDEVFGDNDILNWLDVACEYGFEYTPDDGFTNHKWKIEEA